MQPLPFPSRSKQLLAPSKQAFPVYYSVALLVSAAIVVALFAAFGLAQTLSKLRAADAGGWLPPVQSMLDPLLLAMLASVAALSALSLWVVARYERRLELVAESRARNRAIVDNMLDRAIHIDATGRIVGMNASAERIFGYQVAELKGQPISLLFASPMRERLEAEMRATPDMGLPPALVGLHRLQGRRRDGTTLPLSLAITEVYVGGYLVYTAVVREIGAAEPLGSERDPPGR